MLMSDAPKFLMEDAMRYAVKILNECRVPKHMEVTPYEIFHNKKPTFSDKIQFYSKGSSHISKEERKGKGKLYPKSDIVHFLGHAPHYKNAYLCYDPKHHSVKVRKDVTWFTTENTYSALLTDANIINKTNSTTKKNIKNPRNLHQALNGPQQTEWLQAIRKELNECFNRGTFIKANMPSDQGIKPMKSKIILTIKDDGTYKARWVACGYSQIYGQDYDETFSPTANFKSILTLLHVAAVHQEHIYTVDIGNAFLESTLDRPLYMDPPKDLCTYLNINNEPLLITKGLYGLKQAGKLWFDLLKDLLQLYGFIQSIYDPCVFVYNKDDNQLRVAVHVDDLLITGNQSTRMDDFISYLESKLTKVKCIRDAHTLPI
jgi:phage anti-repressor protein